MLAELLVLRVIHVVGGIFWVGSHLFNAFFLFPALERAGPAAGPIMGMFAQRRLFVVLPTVALLTVLSGVRLLWITSGDFAAVYFDTTRGLTFSVSGGAAILAFLLGIFVARPTAMRMGAIRQSLPAAPDEQARARLAAELDALQRRNAMFARLLTGLLLTAAAGMAVGRYM